MTLASPPDRLAPAAMSPWKRALVSLYGTPILVFALCLAGWTLVSMDQSLFSYAVPGIRNEFHVNVRTLGLVLSASSILSGCAAAVFGALSDRFGRKRVFILCLGCSALIVGGQPLAGSFLMMALFKVTSTAFSVGVTPVTDAYMAEAAPARLRGLLIGLLQCGYPLGWFLASLFASPLMAHFGWRAIFIPALFVAPSVFLLARILPESAQLQASRAQQAADVAGNPKPALASPIRNVAALFAPDLRRKTVSCFLAYFAFGCAYAGTAIYMPTFFHEVRGYAPAVATRLVGLSYGVGIIGYIAAAVLGEFVFTRRNLAIAWAALGMMAAAGLMWISHTYVQDVVFFSLMAAFFFGTTAAMATILTETFPTRVRATAIGFAGSLALCFGSATSPLLVSSLMTMIGWRAAFTIMVGAGLSVCILALLGLPATRSGLDLDRVSEA